MKNEIKQVGDLWIARSKKYGVSTISYTEESAIEEIEMMIENIKKIQNVSKFWDCKFLENLGFGLAIFLLCFGIGTCSALVDGHMKIDISQEIKN